MPANCMSDGFFHGVHDIKEDSEIIKFPTLINCALPSPEDMVHRMIYKKNSDNIFDRMIKLVNSLLGV